MGRSETATTALAEPAGTTELRVLLIEDEPATAAVMSHLLEKLGMRVEVERSGVGGVARFCPDRHDLVITDWQMEAMDGLGVLAAVHERSPLTPVVLATGFSEVELVIQALRAGALDFITKPAKEDEVAACLERARAHLARTRAAASREAQRTLSEQRLESRLDLQQKLLDAIAIPVFCIGADRRYLAVNAAFERFFGVDRRERLGETTAGRATADEQAVCHDQDLVLLADGGLHVYEGTVVRADGSVRRVLMNKATFTDDGGRVAGLVGTIYDMTEERRAEENRARLETAVEHAAEGVVVTDRYGTILYVNPAFLRATGYEAAEVLGRNPRLLKSGQHDAAFYANMWSTLLRGQVFRGRFINRRKDGTVFEEEGTISPIWDANGDIVNFVAVKRDVSEVASLRAQLVQSQKLEAIGQLAAGIAHEINTPTQYIGDNLTYLDETFDVLARLVKAALGLHQSVRSGQACSKCLDTIQELLEECDLELLLEDAPLAIQQSLGGIERVAKIVQATKEFSHPGSAVKELVDLNRALENTVTVARNEWKQVAEVAWDLAPDLGRVPCLPGEMNQVFLNLIVNAAHAIREVVEGSGERGTITISSRTVGSTAEVRIVDTGTGIPEAHRDRVFEPFFTTKEVGKGTGQGLAIARSVVVDKHGGELSFESTNGQGTTFTIRLPREDRQPASRRPGLIEG